MSMALTLHTALQLGDKHRVTTPVNWRPNQDVIVHPSVTDDQARKLFGDIMIHKVNYLCRCRAMYSKLVPL